MFAKEELRLPLFSRPVRLNFDVQHSHERVCARAGKRRDGGPFSSSSYSSYLACWVVGSLAFLSFPHLVDCALGGSGERGTRSRPIARFGVAGKKHAEEPSLLATQSF